MSSAGRAESVPLLEMTPEQWAYTTANKLMGQLKLALLGQAHVRDDGSITLTSGILTHQPVA